MTDYDIIIAGSGIVGSTVALLLSQKTSLKIALLEAQSSNTDWQSGQQYDHRVSAISLASKHLFQQAQVWQAIQAKRVTPYTNMQVWDEAGAGKIEFDCRTVNEPVLGYIIEDGVMRTTLQQKIIDTPAIDFICPVQLASIESQVEKVVVTTMDGKNITARLLIAADGANSWVRNQINAPLKSWDYEQTAIVATVMTELPHQNTAWQRFLTTGPLAFLPLADAHHCSIVWSATHAYAEELLALDNAHFAERLTLAFAHTLGKITQVSKRYHFPLRMRHAKNYVHDSIVLIGDAAHTIHPLAGQGVNMGLLDVACLVEVIKDAQRNFTSPTILRRYERRCKAENLTLLASVDFLKQLFVNQNSLVKNLRNAGLNLVDRAGILKNKMIRYALGER